tara:strand:+ start:1250 stop:1546 length:297 start_codon:yes stop_codon:yes gene_type:complete
MVEDFPENASEAECKRARELGREVLSQRGEIYSALFDEIYRADFSEDVRCSLLMAIERLKDSLPVFFGTLDDETNWAAITHSTRDAEHLLGTIKGKGG